MNRESPRCPLCGSPESADHGAIPDNDFFAGRVLAHALSGGRLWSCRECDSMFRHPLLSPLEYSRLYEAGDALQWSGVERRRDFQLVRAMIESHPTANSILDVGCGSGEFLASLRPEIAKFGAEPSSGAAVFARDRGIDVLAATIDRVAETRRFDIITMIDVIEHVVDPVSLLTQAYLRTAPGGFIIVSTGNPESWAWRRAFSSRFWYVSFPEHIRFPSFRFFNSWADQAGAAAVARSLTRYQSLTAIERGLGFAIQLGFALSPAAFSALGRAVHALRGKPPPRRRRFSPGVPGVFTDHHIVTIRKPGPE